MSGVMLRIYIAVKICKKSANHVQVCFTEKVGSNCLKFPDCGHVYCRDCMAQYITVQINNGQVYNNTKNNTL